jgi:histidine triad (HIT) family protein
MIDDVFCKIASGELPTEFIYRDENVMVFKDIKPDVPIHWLFVPVKHYDDIADIVEQDGELWNTLFRVVHEVARDQGLEKGYRLIINEGEYGGKLVPHLHLHLLSGIKLGPKIVTG